MSRKAFFRPSSPVALYAAEPRASEAGPRRWFLLKLKDHAACVATFPAYNAESLPKALNANRHVFSSIIDELFFQCLDGRLRLNRPPATFTCSSRRHHLLVPRS